MNDFNARDLFAGLAMIGMVFKGDYFTREGLAEDAYKQADAMLKEKEKRDDNAS